jgi:hypothetical protein
VSIGRPNAELTIDGRALSAAEAALESLRVELSVFELHDRFQARLGLLSPFLDVGDDVESVLTGTVSAVERAPWGLLVEGLAASSALSTTRVGRSYVNQSAGDVVDDLVSGAGGTTGEVSATVTLAAFHVDERRSAWAHVRRLARLTGSEVSSAADGAVNFRPVRSGAADRSLRHGADLIAWDVGPRDGGGAGPEVVPFGAASEQGTEKWHLLLREPEGSSPSGPVLVPAALRDRDSAQALADALAAAAVRGAVGGSLVVVGDGSIRAGDLVELTDMPTGEDAVLRVTAVSHLLAPGAGFRTTLTVEGAG